ncbi:MAG: hypothetical protein ACE5K2_05190 [Candidatus Zixiibacteriota bacterium]
MPKIRNPPQKKQLIILPLNFALGLNKKRGVKQIQRRIFACERKRKGARAGESRAIIFGGYFDFRCHQKGFWFTIMMGNDDSGWTLLLLTFTHLAGALVLFCIVRV